MAPLTHADWRRILYPVALAAIERGEHRVHQTPEHTAGIIANYAATDMALTGRTLMLPMDEVEAAQAAVEWVERDASERRAA